jgi:elongation factor Ts
MANYTAADVKRLRELTAAGMMDCKNALVEADGDFDKAVEILRIKGQRGVTKREGRQTSNGAVVAKMDGTDAGALLELACETDFVAKSERFLQVADQIVTQIAAAKPADVSALLATEIDGQTVQEIVDEANITLGEKIEVRRFAQFDDGFVAVYLHKTSPDLPPQVGVLVEFAAADGDASARTARDTAQHIAAFSPRYLSRDDVPADTVENERRIAETTAREEGKPEQALAKIVDGRLNGFFKENVLLDQPFARDNKKSVDAVLTEAGVTLKRFARFRVGTE